MSLTFTASGTLSSVALKDCCTDNAATDKLYIVDTTGPTFKRLSKSGTSIATDYSVTCLANPIGVSMIAAGSAVIVSSSANTVDIMETIAGYRNNIAGGSAQISLKSNGGQIVAGDPSTLIAFAGSNTTNTLVKINANPAVPTATTITFPGLTNDKIDTVTLKGPGRWLLGTNLGSIYEINTNGDVVDEFTSFYDSFPLGRVNAGGGTATFPIYQLSYDNNMLYIGTDSATILMDWSTKTILRIDSPQAATTTSPFIFCGSASGETVGAFNVNTSSEAVALELDFTVQPVNLKDRLYLNTTDNVQAIALNTSNNSGWTAQTNGEIRAFNIVPRDTTTRTVFIQTASSGGTDLRGRLTWVDDSGAVGSSFVFLDTYAQSPATYRIPTGKTVIEVTKAHLGAVALWDVSRFST